MVHRLNIWNLSTLHAKITCLALHNLRLGYNPTKALHNLRNLVTHPFLSTLLFTNSGPATCMPAQG